MKSDLWKSSDIEFICVERPLAPTTETGHGKSCAQFYKMDVTQYLPRESLPYFPILILVSTSWEWLGTFRNFLQNPHLSFVSFPNWVKDLKVVKVEENCCRLHNLRQPNCRLKGQWIASQRTSVTTLSGALSNKIRTSSLMYSVILEKHVFPYFRWLSSHLGSLLRGHATGWQECFSWFCLSFLWQLIIAQLKLKSVFDP